MHFFLKSLAGKWESRSQSCEQGQQESKGEHSLPGCATLGRKEQGKTLCLQFDAAMDVGGRVWEGVGSNRFPTYGT